MDTTINSNEQVNIYTVSLLNREVKRILEDNFMSVWVEGELSNVSRPSSGHLYFSLKDNFAQVRCAMFKNSNRHLAFIPKEGMRVLIRARVSLYPDRGDYQLLVEYLEESGIGSLRIAFDALKKRLLEEGLFDQQHKKAIPPFVKCIGIITSPSGAAIKDILATLKRRFPLVPIIIYPTAVQGQKAKEEIVNAIKIANDRLECDALILARGGGSLEDLWPFNEEMVARSIFNSGIPIITGIGHEVDFTIADFVASSRAATPTAAAEYVSLNQIEIQKQLSEQETSLIRCIKNTIMRKQQQIDYLEKRLISPRQHVLQQRQHLDMLYRALVQNQFHFLKHTHNALTTLTANLSSHNPISQIEKLKNTCQILHQQLTFLIKQRLQATEAELGSLCASLDAYSPLATLSRGFTIICDKEGHIIKEASAVKPGDKINTRLAKGSFSAIVKEIIS